VVFARIDDELYRHWDVAKGVLDLLLSVLVQGLDIVEL
jgi:hypothetical protein